MRSTYLIITLISLFCGANPMTIQELLKESDGVKKKIAAQTTAEGKKSELSKLEDILQATMKAYENQSPQEGTKEEDQVNKLFFSLEPVFELSKGKISKSDCEKTHHRIRIEDRDNTKPNPNELSTQAKDAIAILKLFCSL